MDQLSDLVTAPDRRLEASTRDVINDAAPPGSLIDEDDVLLAGW